MKNPKQQPSPSRINPKIEAEIIRKIQQLSIEGKEVTWPAIVRELGKIGYSFSRQALAAREGIKKTYDAVQSPEAALSLENRYKAHSKALLIKQLQSVREELSEARAEHERTLLLYTYLLQHISEKFPTAMREVENLLAERIALSTAKTAQ